MPKRPNPRLYEILGVPRFSQLDVVKVSYRRLAVKWHPDKEGGDAEKMKIINSAYDELNRYKNEYDAWLRHFLNPRPQMRRVRVVVNMGGWGASSTDSGTTSFTWGGINPKEEFNATCKYSHSRME